MDVWYIRAVEQAKAGFNPFNQTIEDARYRRYQYAARTLRECGLTETIVDVGCGPATGIRAYQEAGFVPIGIEPDVSRARYVTIPGVRIIEQTIEQYLAGDYAESDGASCIHSLEHFHQPRVIMGQIARLVRPGGLVYVEVPDADQSMIDWNDALTLVHMTNFTRKTLRALGEKAGLEFVGYWFPPADPPATSHLACVFRKPGKRVSKLVCGGYGNGLPENPATNPIVFEVPCINDISLCYKATPETIRDTLHKNFSGRKAELCGDVYKIG